MVLLKEAINPAETLKQHGQSWITDDDFRLLASVGANTVGIPVVYWVFVQSVAGEPYVTEGQKAELERILGYCGKYNLHTIIDFHGLWDHRTQNFTLVEEGTWSFTSTVT